MPPGPTPFRHSGCPFLLLDPESNILVAQTNLAITYEALGRHEDALRMQIDIYSGRLRLYGKEHEMTLSAANNYAMTLKELKRFEEAKSVLRKTMPVARRVLGDCHDLMLKMKRVLAVTLYSDDGATLDDLREAVTTLEDVARIARRVLGSAHPNTAGIEIALRDARAALRAREALSPPAGEA